MGNILELEKVCKSFGGIRAVTDVDLSIEEGELHCLIGPNGAGKSTIFKMIVGEYPATSGKIIYQGRLLNKEKQWARAFDGISIKLQVPGVFNNLTLKDNIRIALQNHVKQKDTEAEIKRLTDLVGISDLGNPIVSSLSHGQQQWLEIAMALAPRPKLLLLDEPAAGLGPEETEFTAQLVKRIHKDFDMTIIFIDHDMDFVKRIAKKVTVLHFGRVFAQGSIDEIINDQGVKDIYLGNT